MVKIISSSAEKICDQINFSEMTYKNHGIIIRFKDQGSVQRYDYKSSREEWSDFRRNAIVLFDCFWNYISALGGGKIYIASSEDAPCRVSRFDVLYSASKSDKVILTDSEKIVKRAFMKALRYELHPVFVTENGDVAIMPTDHLDMFIASKDGAYPEGLNPLLEAVEWELK